MPGTDIRLGETGQVYVTLRAAAEFACAAARALLRSMDGDYDMPERILAYVVSVSDYCRVIEAYFDGSAPPRLSDLDDYILIDGAPYVRQDA